MRLFSKGEGIGIGDCAGFGEAIYDGVDAGGDKDGLSLGRGLVLGVWGGIGRRRWLLFWGRES